MDDVSWRARQAACRREEIENSPGPGPGHRDHLHASLLPEESVGLPAGGIIDRAQHRHLHIAQAGEMSGNPQHRLVHASTAAGECGGDLNNMHGWGLRRRACGASAARRCVLPANPRWSRGSIHSRSLPARALLYGAGSAGSTHAKKPWVAEQWSARQPHAQPRIFELPLQLHRQAGGGPLLAGFRACLAAGHFPFGRIYFFRPRAFRRRQAKLPVTAAPSSIAHDEGSGTPITTGSPTAQERP